ncbi:hypothetical protein HC248_02535 [Polaromonas vacuolata]|uniref:Uncharacterized protein n=1 Tax=Polaromonas vacuolata TaxID=37448 RepID=A0A6H2HC89_9BURK|nr:hypothetical protein [Polaromonas vacuolata]QJC57214.1 hypothetical protein HC248_02535 [Polaromonas vacuolata]
MSIDKNPDLNRTARLPLTATENAAIKAPNGASRTAAQSPQNQRNLQELQVGAFMHELINYQRECESQLIEHLEAGFLQAELEQAAALQRAELKHQASRAGEVLDPQRFLLAKDEANVAGKPAPSSDETLTSPDAVGAVVSPVSVVVAKDESHATSKLGPIKR